MPAQAVILYRQAERNGPPDPSSIAFAAWQLQGQFGGFLGTPIAPHYFVTAAHVGTASQFVYQGTTYTIDTSFGHGGREVLSGSDLAVWKIEGSFPTYAPLYTSSNEAGQHLVVIGRGTQRGDEVRVRGRLKGWLWGAADGVQSWGENEVDRIINGGTNIGDLLEFDFDAGGLANEGTLSSGDSGGGVFIQDGGVWKLAGINYSVGGPISTSPTGADPILGSFFDLSGLYVQVGENQWQPGRGPNSAYASRLSSRASAIYALAPGCPVVEQNYTVHGYANMGNVDVSGTTAVGDGISQAVLKANYIRGNTLMIEAGSQVVINPNGTEGGISRLSTLSIAQGGQFDLSNNGLVVQAESSSRESTLALISSLVGSGRNGGDGIWQGSGIVSSTAAENAQMGLVVILNDDGRGNPLFTTFGGQVVDVDSVLVQYAWNGDANLDGVIDISDYFLIDRGFLTKPASPRYRDGDFNFDGRIDISDYFLIDSAFLWQRGASRGAFGEYVGMAVPEPGVIGTIGLLGLGALMRRGRREHQTHHDLHWRHR